jgi:hypothetical protein
MSENKDLKCVFKGEAFEAEIVKGRLESEGIPAMIMNNSMSAILSTYTITSGNVSVLVNAENEDKAKEILVNENA